MDQTQTKVCVMGEGDPSAEREEPRKKSMLAVGTGADAAAEASGCRPLENLWTRLPPKEKRRQEEGERRQRREGSSEGEKAKGKEEKGFGPQHLSPTIATLS